MTTPNTRALTPEHIRLIVNPIAPFVAAIVDMMPSYEMSPANIDTELAKAARYAAETPAIRDAIVAAGSGLSLSEVQEIPGIQRAMIFADVLAQTQRALTLTDILRAIMDEVRPLSLYATGARH